MKAAIFDMDGLLIDSEPLWQEAEISVFGSVGVPLTTRLCRQTAGLRIDEVVRYWYDRFPWEGTPMDAVEARILDVVRRLIVERGKPLPGVTETIGKLSTASYELAVASSSPMHIIRTALETLSISRFFPVVHSADAEDAGKPDPAVYLSTMSRLGADPDECIAFEDSVFGVRAAKSAGARVIAVPDPTDASQPGFRDADVVLSSLLDFSLELVQ